MGIANYYSRFVRGFAALAAPISGLLAGQRDFVWGDAQQQAFDRLKAALTLTPTLTLPDFTKPFVVSTDHSGVVIGAVLQQPMRGALQPVCYFSRKLNSAKKN